jgi:hypothetical protein
MTTGVMEQLREFLTSTPEGHEQSLCPWNGLRKPLDNRLEGLQIRSGHDDEDKYPCRRESNLSRPSCSLIILSYKDG